MQTYKQLIDILRQKQITLSTAESCTGGLIAKLITDVPGSSEIYLGGVISYSNEMKKKWLGVKSVTLQKFGAVSEQTVLEMLNGIIRATTSDLAVAVSGIAGPNGGTKEKPVGTVFIGIGFKDRRLVQKFLFPGSRDQVRASCANQILIMIHNIIN